MTAQNEALLSIFLEKVRREYAQDIALVFTYGSVVRGDDGPTSDLDLVFVPKTSRGKEMSMSFVCGGIGYDFFPMTWARLERIASFEEPMQAIIAGAQVVYTAGREFTDRFEDLRGWIVDMMDTPLSRPMVDKARAEIERAMACCARMQMAEEESIVRMRSASALYHISNAVVMLNNRYFKDGIKHQLAELRAMRRLPDAFALLYEDTIKADGEDDIRDATWALMASTNIFFDDIDQSTREMEPPAGVLTGAYEEFVCNWKNKIAIACETGDAETAYLAGVSCQHFFDTLAARTGMRRIQLMGYFSAGDLPEFRRVLEDADKAFRGEVERLYIKVVEYPGVDAFRKEMLG